MDDNNFLLFLHSLVRWLVLPAVAFAAFVNWRGLVLKAPIIVWERAVTIAAMVICHVQLLIGLILYMLRFKAYTMASRSDVLTSMSKDVVRYWKYEHIGMMVLAVLLVTLGRILSKRAQAEGAKQLLIAVFYTAALFIMLWSIPWPFTFLGMGRGWL